MGETKEHYEYSQEQALPGEQWIGNVHVDNLRDDLKRFYREYKVIRIFHIAFDSQGHRLGDSYFALFGMTGREYKKRNP